jgi:hypothetical protein
MVHNLAERQNADYRASERLLRLSEELEQAIGLVWDYAKKPDSERDLRAGQALRYQIGIKCDVSEADAQLLFEHAVHAAEERRTNQAPSGQIHSLAVAE